MKKRLLSLLLVVCMALSMLPATAYAAVSDLLPNSRGQNQEILDQLSALTEGNSAQAYALLEQLGLLDENGQLPGGFAGLVRALEEEGIYFAAASRRILYSLVTLLPDLR